MDDYQAHDLPRLIAPPPLIYAAAMGIGLLAQRLQPAALLPRPIAPLRRLAGAVPVLGGLGLVGWAVAAMYRAGTGPDPRHPSSALVVDGPFRFSRNPIYLGMTAIYLGIALWRNARWCAALLPITLLLIQRGVIEREETYLHARFGEAYRAYQRRVPRWL